MQHKKIYLAMEKHNSADARKAMREHLDFANKYKSEENVLKTYNFMQSRR